MIHFQHSALLYLWLAIPLLVALWVWLALLGRKRLQGFAPPSMFARLIPDASRWRPHVKFGLIMLGLFFLIAAAANPQVGSRMVKGQRLGSDVAICLDVSNSMMAEDIQPNRLERSKRVVTNLINELGGDRVSLVVFAGSSYIQMPLTNDYSAAKLFLDQIDCSMIASQGTAIGDAIGKAMQSFGYGDSEREWDPKRGRAIIVISDGENHEDDAEQAAADAADEGVMVCTVGMGLPDGAPIPVYNANGQRTGFRRDSEGNTVSTFLNEQMLSAIAHAGKGLYVRGGSTNSNIGAVVDQLDKLEKSHYGDALFSEYESRYYYPLAAALLCLAAELLIFERRNRKINLGRLFLLALLLLPLASMAQSPAPHPKTQSAKAPAKLQRDKALLHKGNASYANKKYDEAELFYRKAIQKDSTYWQAQYNLGNCLYRQKKYDKAAQRFNAAAQLPGTDSLQRSRIFHNLGNSHLMAGLDDRDNGMQHFQQAVDAYQEALKLNHHNDDTRYNLSYAKKLLHQAQQNQQNKGGGGDNNQQDQQNKDQQKQQGQQNQQDQQNQQGQQKQQDQQNKDQQGNGQPQQPKQGQQMQQGQQDKKKQDAERILRALSNNEKNTMREHQRQLEAGSPRRTDKDW